MDYQFTILNQGSDCGGQQKAAECGCSTGCGGCHGTNDEASRRDFLKNATSFTLGSFVLTMLPASASDKTESEDQGQQASSPSPPKAGPLGKGILYGFLVDVEKCVGTGKCLSACRIENNVPEGYARTWVERFVHYKDGRVEVDRVPEHGYDAAQQPEINPEEVERAYFVPKLCNQCTDAPCNQVCPVHASIKSPEGIELVDTERCIGCSYCVQACPYGIRFMNPETNNADKCNWCYHRIMQDQSPACVEACPTGARVFGRLDDPESELCKRLSEVPTQVLKEHLGTDPNLWYVGLSSEVT